ncbi:MAG: hypothetical protein K2M79_04895 [Muribaculaceae bacterium]|nr:hypothetical protein [Muribaculaceae bacterium]
MSLKDAFNALSNVPNISVRSDYNFPILGLTENGECAAALNLNEAQIRESGNAVYTILNQVPLAWMINGGNNNLAAAFIYASPESTNGIYEVLMVVMGGKLGEIAIVYGGIDKMAKDALQNAPLKMEADKISIHASLPNGDTYDIQTD